MAMPDSQRHSLKLCLIKYKLENINNDNNYFQFFFQKILAHFYCINSYIYVYILEIFFLAFSKLVVNMFSLCTS